MRWLVNLLGGRSPYRAQVYRANPLRNQPADKCWRVRQIDAKGDAVFNQAMFNQTYEESLALARTTGLDVVVDRTAPAPPRKRAPRRRRKSDGGDA